MGNINLIGISGRIGSGKDTLANMIQYLTAVPRGPKPFNPKVNYSIDSPWEIKKFAGKLKQIASLMLGVPVGKFEDQAFKDSVLGPEWNYLVFSHPVGEPTGVREVPMTVRLFLQRLGTDAIRDHLHSEAWVNALFADYKGYPWFVKRHDQPREDHVSYPKWIITDVRFPNEAEAIKRRGGLLFGIYRGKTSDKLESKLHISETALYGYGNWNESIDNNGSLEDLMKAARDIVDKYDLS